MDKFSEQRLSLVIPELADKIHLVYEQLKTQGIEIRVVQGLRTFAEQDALYAQRPKVTNAPGGYSMHNFGLAVDCMPDKVHGAGVWSPDPNAGDENYEKMVAVAESLGLVSGSEWHALQDWPHLELGNMPVTPTDQMRKDFYAGGLPLVWTNYSLGKYGS